KTRLVTITIGGDDLVLLENTCASQSQDVNAIAACIEAGLGRVLATYARNLTEIYIAIRILGHYDGPIVAVNYFSPDYTNVLVTPGVAQLNAITQGLTAAFGGKVADAFTAFQAASVPSGLPCAATPPLAFPTPGGLVPCDVHPTVEGQQLIAPLVAQALQ